MNHKHDCDMEVNALLDEMRFWTRQLDEHARIIRSGVDLGEDNVIDEANQFVRIYDCLSNRLNDPDLIPDHPAIDELLKRTKTAAAGLREFKIKVENGIAKCRIKALISADLINHVRRELDFFIGNLDAVTGGPIPTWEDLGLDHSSRKVSLVPRMLLKFVEKDLIREVSLEELLFWLHISGDHALLLARYFIPVLQAQFTADTSRFGTEFNQLHQQTLDLAHSRDSLRRIMQNSNDLNLRWIAYLDELNLLLANCRIPGGQTNFWPALGAHIRREQGYFQSVLEVLLPKQIS